MEKLRFSALVAFEDSEGRFRQSVQIRGIEDLPPGEVLIKVVYSSLNYKDALSACGNRGVTKHYPHTPGIDAAGVVINSTSADWRIGDQVICTGYDLGMNTPGGFGQYIRVPGRWLVRLPDSLTFLEAMQLGTAGFTAALCVSGLQKNDIIPGHGSVLVTGATGGVGSIAILLLHHLGYEVIALTGKVKQAGYLRDLGATHVLDRNEFLTQYRNKLLLPPRWEGVVDTVGGEILSAAIKATNFDGVVTSCGNAASADLPLNVFPFILRGVHLLGIYSANCSMEKRVSIWNNLAGKWKIPELRRICRHVKLHQVRDEIKAMLNGGVCGRCVVDLEGE